MRQPLFSAIAPMIGLKSHVRRMLRSGTVVPAFVLMGAAKAVAVARGNAAAEIAMTAVAPSAGVCPELFLRLCGLLGQLVDGFVALFSTHVYRATHHRRRPARS